MTEEQKDLLFKDLCGRIPYGVKVQTGETPFKTLECMASPYYFGDIKSFCFSDIDWLGVTPYLFPLSSMTDEQKEEHQDLIKNHYGFDANGNVFTLQDFYCKYHFDYHNLIPMGLAIDCTYLNIY